MTMGSSLDEVGDDPVWFGLSDVIREERGSECKELGVSGDTYVLFYGWDEIRKSGILGEMGNDPGLRVGRRC